MEDYKTNFEKLIQRIYDLTVKGCIDEKVGKAILKDFTLESEDEKIRKELIEMVRLSCTNGDDVDKKIAWLEKKGEQKPIFRVGDYIRNTTTGDKVLIEQLDLATKAYCYVSYDGAAVNHSDFPFVKQDEWELVEQKPADKVEPKFKVGDWCIDNEDNTIYQITNVLANLYYYRTNEGKEYACTQDSIERDAHLWTIQDAKSGDVLAGHECIVLFKEIDGLNIKCHCTYHFMNNPSFYVNTLQNKSTFHPATKEQRDLLFAKMKKAGYEWDSEKKELKKIEQEEDVELTDFESALFSAFSDAWQEYLIGKEVNVEKWAKEHSAELLEAAREQNTAWSEEDERMFNTIVGNLNNGEWFDIYQADWLKSLKERIQPKHKQEEIVLHWESGHPESHKSVLILRHGNVVVEGEWNEETGRWYQYGFQCYLEDNEVIGWMNKKSLLSSNSNSYSHWNPSDEQMEVLHKYAEQNNYDGSALTSLYRDLKKLKGE